MSHRHLRGVGRLKCQNCTFGWLEGGSGQLQLTIQRWWVGELWFNYGRMLLGFSYHINPKLFQSDFRGWSDGLRREIENGDFWPRKFESISKCRYLKSSGRGMVNVLPPSSPRPQLSEKPKIISVRPSGPEWARLRGSFLGFLVGIWVTFFRCIFQTSFGHAKFPNKVGVV